jgi:capsular polysaccharide biosynthesis protein
MNSLRRHAEEPAVDTTVPLEQICDSVDSPEALLRRGSASLVAVREQRVSIQSTAGNRIPSASRDKFLQQQFYTANPLTLHSLTDAQLFGSGIFVLDSQRRVVRESIAHWARAARPRPLGERTLARYIRNRASREITRHFGRPKLQRNARFLPGTYALASSQFESNIFHWHADLLPVADLLLSLLPAQRIPVLIGAQNEFAVKSLRYLGVPPELIVPLPEDEVISVERLILCSTHANQAPRLHPRIGEMLRRIKGQVVPQPIAEAKRRLFLSRGSSTRRLLLNRRELEERFHLLGFQVIDPGKLSYETQVRLFDEAEIVVGEHGAAFANIGFCRPSTKVIELYHPRSNGMCYLSLAAINGLQHHYFVGTCDPSPMTRQAEWQVDVDGAAGFVEAAMNSVGTVCP